ncbi:MAG: integrase [Clostridiales bacterium GWE2_32_10]|nr:MAG: integrase [Clostridiales bacterium GWE2_32_10]
MCKTLGISKSRYYELLEKRPGKRKLEDEKLKGKIKKIWEESKKRYRSPKIRAILIKKGYKVGLPRIQKLMREEGVKSIVVKKYKLQSRKKEEEKQEYENKLEQNFEAQKPNEKWVTDITYIWTKKDGWCYLASVMDIYNNEKKGWTFDKSMTVELIKKALENAVKRANKPRGTIVHSDRGSQYTSSEYRRMLKKYGMVESYNKKGCPYDNACIESFHASIKKELIYVEEYETYEDALKSIFEYIESFYNRKRIQEKLGYKSPTEFGAAA